MRWKQKFPYEKLELYINFFYIMVELQLVKKKLNKQEIMLLGP